MLKKLRYCVIRFMIVFTFLNLLHQTAVADDLREEFGGYQVKFDYEKYPDEREIAYRYFTKLYEISDSELSKDDIGIDLYDINDDQHMEILAYIQNGAYCGSKGCAFEILKSGSDAPDDYRSLSLHITVPEDIKILNSTTLGYHDINFSGNTWRWNGKNYDIDKVTKN